MASRNVWTIALTGFAAATCGGDSKPDTCLQAHRARDWPIVARDCRGSSPLGRLGEAWHLHYGEPDPECAIHQGVQDVQAEAARRGAALLATPLSLDATYLVGRALNKNKNKAIEKLGQRYIELAQFRYYLHGRHRDVAKVGTLLSHLRGDSSSFEASLAYAELALEMARRSGDPVAEGAALTSVGEAYDDLGMIEDARERFLAAKELLRGAPEHLANALLRHGMMILDADPRSELPTAIAILDAALAASQEAVARGRPIDRLRVFSIRLNLATALAEDGQSDKARVVMSSLEPIDDAEKRKIALVEGFIAARSGDLSTAEARFEALSATEDTLEQDYRWRIAYELGELYRRDGRVEDAVRAYEHAIAVVDQLRSDTKEIELRSRVQERRALPHRALLSLRASRGEGVEALTLAESLYARTWADVVLGIDRRSQSAGGSFPSVVTARLRRAAELRSTLTASEIAARVRDREVLIFVASSETEVWRIHVVGGVTKIEPLSADDLAAGAAFTADPDDATKRVRAATALLPPDLTASDAPLYVIAKGDLAGVPFAALQRGERFLVEDRPITRLPGLAAMECRRLRWTERRVYLGDSDVSRPLRRAAAEVQRLAGDAALTGSRATTTAFERAGDSSLLYVAVHGELTLAGGALTLSDAPFTAAEVFDKGIAPREVVLMGCATAASADAEAWSGFPSAFLAAGSRFVVATSQAVDDAIAEKFSIAYEDQDRAMDPIRRMTAAQRASIAKQRATGKGSVMEWASFAAWGDPACRTAE